MSYDLIVIGGGAAGFFGALACAEACPNARILVLEKAATVLAKVKISGGGRCNVTNAQMDPARLVENYPRGGQALRGALTRFGTKETAEWFKRRGVALKAEPDGRMFPVTDSSQTIIECFLIEASRRGLDVRTHAAVESVQTEESGFRAAIKDGATLSSRYVLLASGGDRSGFGLAQSLGHTIVPPVPSLFTFNVPDPRLEGLAGLSAADARARLPEAGLEQRGSLLITHWGLSGPAVLRLSAWGARFLHETGYQAELRINWLPEFNPDSLYQRLLALKESEPKHEASTRDPFGKLPARLWKRLTAAAGIGEEQAWGECGKGLLNRLAEELCLGRFEVRGKGAFKEEFVTCGGVSLKEVDFKTMQSRVTAGLFLAGEALDIDGVTGGFNFQSAWTTGHIAGTAIAEKLNQDEHKN